MATTPDYREIRKWVESGGPLRDWPMLNTNCGRCRLAAGRCRREAEAIVAKAEAEGRELTAKEQESIEVFAAAYPILCQSDAVMYPAPIQGPTYVGPVPDDAIAYNRELARGTTICPRCSTPAAEQKLRHECIEAGYGILPTGVFVTQPFNQDEVEFRVKGPSGRVEAS